MSLEVLLRMLREVFDTPKTHSGSQREVPLFHKKIFRIANNWFHKIRGYRKITFAIEFGRSIEMTNRSKATSLKVWANASKTVICPRVLQL